MVFGNSVCCGLRMKHAIYDFKQKIIVEENGTLELSVDFPLNEKNDRNPLKDTVQNSVSYLMLLLYFKVNFITETNGCDIRVGTCI